MGDEVFASSPFRFVEQTSLTCRTNVRRVCLAQCILVRELRHSGAINHVVFQVKVPARVYID